MTPYYQQNGIVIYNSDMLNADYSIGRFDAVVTDPPYGETCLEWDRWPVGWPEMMASLTSQLWCFGSMRMFLDRADEFLGWKFAQDLVWEKHNGSGLHADRFRRVHENAVHFYKGDWALIPKNVVTEDVDERSGQLRRKAQPSHFNKVSGGSGYTYGGTRIVRSVLRVRSCHGEAEHPTQKPEGIIRPILQYSVPQGGCVLDPFMGSGTTLLVAKQMGLRAVGIEISEKFCEVAARRLQQGILLPA